MSSVLSQISRLIGLQGSDMENSPIKSDDIVIAVVGVTGVGKSTFINYFTNEEVEIGTSLESCTQEVRSFKCSLPDIPKFYLIDTPGFDDSTRSDADVLRSLSQKLAEAYAGGIKLSGIIYLHRIMDVRFGGAAGRQLRMFKRLCGNDSLDSVVLATTFWQNVTLATAEEREEQLRTDPKFWATLIEHKSKVFRQDRGRDSGEKIIRYLIDRRKRVTLQIQHELVSEKKTFAETGAAAEVLGDLQELRAGHEREIANLERDKKRAIEERDKYWENEIREDQLRHLALIERDEKAVGRLRRTWEDVRFEISDRFQRCIMM